MPPYAFTLIYFRGNICDSDFKDYIDELLISKGGAKKLQENRFTITTHIHSSSAPKSGLKAQLIISFPGL